MSELTLPASVLNAKDKIWLEVAAGTPTYLPLHQSDLSFKPVQEKKGRTTAAALDSDGNLHRAQVVTQVGEEVTWKSIPLTDGNVTPGLASAIVALKATVDQCGDNAVVTLLIAKAYETPYTAPFIVTFNTEGGAIDDVRQLEVQFDRQPGKADFNGTLPSWP